MAPSQFKIEVFRCAGMFLVGEWSKARASAELWTVTAGEPWPEFENVALGRRLRDWLQRELGLTYQGAA